MRCMVNPELRGQPKMSPKQEPHPGYFESLVESVKEREAAERALQLDTEAKQVKARGKRALQSARLESDFGRRLTPGEKAVLLPPQQESDYREKLAVAVAEAKNEAAGTFPSKEVKGELQPSREWEWSKDGGRAALEYVLQYSDLDEETWAKFEARLDPDSLRPSDFKRLLPKEKLPDFQQKGVAALEDSLDEAVEDLKDGSMTVAERERWHREILLLDIKAASVLVLPSKQEFEAEFKQSLSNEGAPFTDENVELFCDTKDAINRSEYNELVKIAKSYNPDLTLPAYEVAVGLSDARLESVIHENFGLYEASDFTRDPWEDFGKPERLLYELADRYQMLAVVGGIIRDTRRDLLDEATRIQLDVQVRREVA